MSAESLLCPVRKRHGIPHWPCLDTSHGHAALASSAGQLQHFMSQLLKNSRGWKRSKQHRVFMTSPRGLSWHPVLAAASYLSSTASVSCPGLFPTSVWGTHSPPISTRTNPPLEGRGAHSYFGISHTQTEPQIKCPVLWTKPVQFVMSADVDVLSWSWGYPWWVLVHPLCTQGARNPCKCTASNGKTQ